MPSPEIEMKFNVVSIANFIALIGVLVTAVSSYYGFVAKVDVAQNQIQEIAKFLDRSIIERKMETKALSDRDELLTRQVSDIQSQTTQRLTTVEVELRNVSQNMGRIDTQLQRFFERNLPKNNSLR